MSYDATILMPDEILNTEHYVSKQAQSKIYRDGILLEKGAVLSPRKIDSKIDLFKKYCWYWSIYPDRYIDLITPVGSKFKLKFYQRIFLRACL